MTTCMLPRPLHPLHPLHRRPGHTALHSAVHGLLTDASCAFARTDAHRRARAISKGAEK
jgi:hypothetical protein